MSSTGRRCRATPGGEGRPAGSSGLATFVSRILCGAARANPFFPSEGVPSSLRLRNQPPSSDNIQRLSSRRTRRPRDGRVEKAGNFPRAAINYTRRRPLNGANTKPESGEKHSGHLIAMFSFPDCAAGTVITMINGCGDCLGFVMRNPEKSTTRNNHPGKSPPEKFSRLRAALFSTAPFLCIDPEIAITINSRSPLRHVFCYFCVGCTN